MDLEIVILSEDCHTDQSKSSRGREILQYDIPFMQNLQRNDTMNLFMKQKQTHRLMEGTYSNQPGRMG